MEPRFPLERLPRRSSEAGIADRSFGIAPPRLAPPLVLGFLSLLLLLATGFLTVAAVTGRLPAWCDPTHTLPLRSLGVEILVASIGLINLLGATVATLAFAGRARRLLQHRFGRASVEEFEGPCFLAEEGPGIWSLRLELAQEREPGARLALVPGSFTPESGVGSAGVLDDPDPPSEIAFYLDEGTAARISRIFHPWEVLRLSWLDLPLSSGGPALLEIRDAHVAAATEEPPEALAA
jgi:hypothetical protein